MSDISHNDSAESPDSSSYGGPASPTLVDTPLEEFPRRSQAPSSHVPGYLDSLLPLPMLQYPQDPPLPPTISSPSDRCLPDQSAPPSPAMTSPQTPIDQLSMGLSSLPRPTLTATAKTLLPKKWSTKRSWMTVKRRSSFLKP